MKEIFVLAVFIVCFVLVKNLDVFSTQETKVNFQRPPYYRTLSLNYTTLASSLLWVRSMIDYGELLRKRSENEGILDNGIVLAELDPGFKKIYFWFPAIALGSQVGPSYEDFEQIDTLMQIGADYNDDPSINYSAALNHIGYNRNLNDDQRRAFYQKAALFLEPVLNHPLAPPLTSQIYAYLKKGGHFRDGIDPEKEVEFISRLLSSAGEIDRKSLLRRLAELGYSDLSFRQNMENEKEFQKNKKNCCDYYSDAFMTAFGF